MTFIFNWEHSNGPLTGLLPFIHVPPLPLPQSLFLNSADTGIFLKSKIWWYPCPPWTLQWLQIVLCVKLKILHVSVHNLILAHLSNFIFYLSLTPLLSFKLYGLFVSQINQSLWALRVSAQVVSVCLAKSLGPSHPSPGPCCLLILPQPVGLIFSDFLA